MATPLLLLPGLLGLALALALAAAVHRAAPERAANRRLAIALLFEGILVGFLSLATALPGVLGGWSPLSAAVFAGSASALAIVPWLYLLFLATLDTPLTRPLRTRRFDLFASGAGLVGVALLPASSLVLRSAPIGEVWFDAYFLAMPTLLVFVSLFGLAAALHAWRRAPAGTARRRQAGSFALAFGARDTLWAIFVLPSVLDGFGVWPNPLASHTAWFLIGPPLIIVVFVPLAAYGILRTQLFDIDLRIQWTLRQSTLAGVFVAVFFAASEATAAFLGDRTGSAYVGIAAASLLLFALAPLQRVAERVAHVAMPGVRPSSDYLAYKKLEVYRAAVEGALEDGALDEADRAVLARLREKLAIAAEDAAAMEDELLRAHHEQAASGASG